MKSLPLAVLTIAALSICVVADEPSQLKVTTKRAEDKVEVVIEQRKALISLRCDSGIGAATIERSNREVASEVAGEVPNTERSNIAWPEQVTIKLHLRGLESLKITNGHVTLQASLPSGVKRPNLRLWKDEQESALDAKSPFWMDVRMFNSDARPAESIPLNDGYFLIRLPKVLFESAEPQGVPPTTISLSWIDFYR